MEGHLHAAMKAVGQAIKLDGDGKNREAYYRYLACIRYISQVVLEESKNQGYQGPIKTKCTARMLKLAQQCMDRTSAIMENTEDGDATHLAPPPGNQSGRFSPSIHSFNSATSSTCPGEQSKPVARTYEPPMAFGALPQSAEQPRSQDTTLTTSLPVPVGYMRPPVARKDKLSPLEAAYLENRRIMNSYKARLVQLMETNRGKGQLQKTTLNLTLQRRLMENMAIARAREAALAKKIQERHQRLQEEAARRFSTTGEPTKAEMELRQMYASVMEFENNEGWLVEWRQKLRETPKDLHFIHALIGQILACPIHPFTQLLKKFQYTVYQSLLPLIKKDAEELEQIKVPYKTVEPLVLAGSKHRVVSPNGFATPGDLMDKSLDEDLMRRLHALRNSSHDERRESLYGDMLASSSSLDEDEEDDMWDELNSGDNTLEDGIGGETEEAAKGGTTAPNSDSASINSQGSIEVELCDISKPPRDSCHSDRKTDEDANLEAALPRSSVGESGDEGKEENTASKENSTEISTVESDENISKDIEEDNDDAVSRMKRISREVQEDLQEALVEGEELTRLLEKQIKEDLAEGTATQNGEGGDTNGETPEEYADIPGEDDDRLEAAVNLEEGKGEHDEIPEGAQTNHGSDSGSEEKHRPQSDSEREQESAVDAEHAFKNNSESENSTPAGSPEQDLDSRRPEGEHQGQNGERILKEEKEERERIAKLQEDALQRHLKHISKDIQSYLDRLQSLLVAIYEELDSAVAKEQCIAVIEKHFFHVIWQPLLTLFRRANLRREISAATAMTKYQNALPENIGIIKKLCLASDEAGSTDRDNYPYRLAVEELRRISGYFSPLEKLECVVKASRAIITCVGDYYEAQGRSRENMENAVGCDDLLPILSFVVIKSALPHIVSECSIMEEFIHEGYLFGEEGYCLTTLQTSLGYVLKLAED